MIDKALAHIVKELDEHLKSQMGVKEPIALLSGMMNQDGTIAVQGENKIIVTLVQIQEDRTIRMQTREAAVASANLHILVSAYFAAGNYNESLRMISMAMNFFRDKPVLTMEDTDGSNPKTIAVSLENADFEMMNNIWSMLGAKYMPCLLYRVRAQ